MKTKSENETAAQRVGDAIRQRRLSWPGGMTLKRLAQRTGIALSTIASYETGRCLPRLMPLFVLTRELGIDLNALAAHGDAPADQKEEDLDDQGTNAKGA